MNREARQRGRERQPVKFHLPTAPSFIALKLFSLKAVGPEVTAAGGEFVSVGPEEAVTDGNLLTGPAWTAHVEWLRQSSPCLEVRGKRPSRPRHEKWLNSRRVRVRCDTPAAAGWAG